jgi:type II secretory pathway pseudopilin PulG
MKEKKSQKLNKQKGFSAIGLLASLATASIIIGGVSVSAGDLLIEAKDTQKVANIKQLATVMELYYSDYQKYPEVTGEDSTTRINDLTLQVGEYLASPLTEKDKYDYQDSNSGQNYVLKVILENPESSYLEADPVLGADCPKPYYCVKI